MLQRIITGAIIAVLMIVLVVFSGTAAFPVVMTLLTVMATYEMLSCVGTIKNPFICVPALFASLCSAVCAYFFGYAVCLSVVMMYLVVLMAMCVFFDEKVKVTDVLCSFSSTLYVMLCFAAFTALRKIDGIGLYMFLLVFIAAWITDTFAYFTGYFLGKHKLIPSVSPKKTVEGSVGGIAGAVIIVILFQLICSKYFDCKPNYLNGVIIAIVCSIMSQFGDLAASCIKREHNVKDFGNIMPGHGGILDRFDSVIYISPILFILLNYIKLI